LSRTPSARNSLSEYVSLSVYVLLVLKKLSRDQKKRALTKTLMASSKMRKTSRSGCDDRSRSTVTECRTERAARSSAFSHCRVKSTLTSLNMLSRKSACW
jgi:hypothetical protein